MAIIPEERNNEELIPGLPNDVAELCLLHLPYPYNSLVRTVSSSWNTAVTDPTFVVSKKSLSLSLPYLFVFASHKSTAKNQWQALDPSSGRWFVLPPMPSSAAAAAATASFASLPRQGKLFVLGGARSGAGGPTRTAAVYSTSTNQWSEGKDMTTPRSCFEAAAVGGKIVAVGGESITAVEVYDPDTDTWTTGSDLPSEYAKYSSAVVGGELCVTEGWTWPFLISPRGAIYDAERDAWRPMRRGMREGWTGVSAVVGGRLVVVSEHGDCPVKIYDPDHDTWQYVGGEKFPCGALRRPFAVSGLDGKICVVASGLNVGIGSLVYGRDGDVAVTWRVLTAPIAFHGFSPSTCQVLYA